MFSFYCNLKKTRWYTIQADEKKYYSFDKKKFNFLLYIDHLSLTFLGCGGKFNLKSHKWRVDLLNSSKYACA